MPKGRGKLIPRVEVDRDISTEQSEELIKTLETRFLAHMDRHEALDWAAIQAKLAARPEKVASLHAMECTGGEPDVVGYDQQSDEYIFCDCSEQSPAGSADSD